MDFKQQIQNIVNGLNIPYEKIVVRSDKWGKLASVYFLGLTSPSCIGDDQIEDSNSINDFIIDTKQGSGIMEYELKLSFGPDYRKYKKLIN